jgi:hypothetical protein
MTKLVLLLGLFCAACGSTETASVPQPQQTYTQTTYRCMYYPYAYGYYTNCNGYWTWYPR